MAPATAEAMRRWASRGAKPGTSRAKGPSAPRIAATSSSVIRQVPPTWAFFSSSPAPFAARSESPRMDKSFEPSQIESKWYAQWEANGYFKPSGKGTPYTIMLPPPNVTGTLHMGHAFQHTIMDTLVRYHRMRGYDTLWQLGTDHAGIATEMVVTRQLNAEGKQRSDFDRDAFIARVWEWKAESGDTIGRQMRRMGVSGDWSREVFTMDPGPSKAVVETFVRLHEEGLIYRGQKLVNWDPVLKTAISDLEVVSEEEDGSMWSIRYPLADGPGGMGVGHPRPRKPGGGSFPSLSIRKTNATPPSAARCLPCRCPIARSRSSATTMS